MPLSSASMFAMYKMYWHMVYNKRWIAFYFCKAVEVLLNYNTLYSSAHN